jgi:hypothetical protein
MTTGRERPLDIIVSIKHVARLQLLESDLTDNDFFGEVDITYDQATDPKMPNPVVIGSNEGRNYRYDIYWEGL